MDKIKKDTPIQPRTGISNVRVDIQRTYAEWVPVTLVMPNPLNPRKRDDYKSEDLQKVIRQRGWEMPLTVYKKGQMYVVLSGHRRLYAARQMSLKEIPVYVVPAPKTHQEEIERIASAQAHQEDWTVLEWAKFTYERWIAWGKPAFQRFAKDIGLSKRTAESYCFVLDYFPMDEIEAGIKNKSYALSTLHEIVIWMRDLKKYHPSLVERLSEELMRRLFLSKLGSKKISREALKRREYLQVAKESDLQDFFTQPELSLEEIMLRNEFNINEKSFHGKTISIGHAKKNVKNLIPKNKIEANKAVRLLAEMQEAIDLRLKEIERVFPGSIEKEDLFTWKKR